MVSHRVARAHLYVLVAEIMWGISAPVGKLVMNHGLNGLQLVTLRIAGSAVLFWVASLFVKPERVVPRDLARLALAGLLAIGFNQTLFSVGLSLTSPINATILPTMMPVLTMFFAFLFLHEPISWLKAGGIALSMGGALLMVWHSSQGMQAQAGNAEGDLLILMAQFCFALYLTLFRDVLHRYGGITCMKWMFTFSLVLVVPFTGQSFRSFEWSGHEPEFWWGIAYIVIMCTFLCYLLLMAGQQVLRPTLVSIYNYVQPVVSCLLSVAIGMAVFGLYHAAAIVLVALGVVCVARSKSRAQQLAEQETDSPHNPRP